MRRLGVLAQPSWEPLKRGSMPMADTSMVTLLRSAPQPKSEPVRPDSTPPAQPGGKIPLQVPPAPSPVGPGSTPRDTPAPRSFPQPRAASVMAVSLGA